MEEKHATHLREELQASRQGGYLPTTPEEKRYSRALNRKFDLFILPFCVLIYMFNGLDRSNLGNAQTDNFTQDLGMRPEAINTLLAGIEDEDGAGAAGPDETLPAEWMDWERLASTEDE